MAEPTRFGVVPVETMKAESGLDFLQGMIDGRHPAPPICRLLGFRLIELERGRALFTGTPTEEMLNPIGTIHGGWAATLLDSAMACAVQSMLDQGQGYTTLEFKVTLLRAVLPGSGEMRAEGKSLHAGRRAAAAEARLTDAAGKLYAHATTSCVVFPL